MAVKANVWHGDSVRTVTYSLEDGRCQAGLNAMRCDSLQPNVER